MKSNLNQRPKRPIRHLRWWIIGVCFLGTMVNYIDRQCLSVAAPTICEEFGFSNADYSSIVSFFLAAYTIMQFISGPNSTTELPKPSWSLLLPTDRDKSMKTALPSPCVRCWFARKSGASSSVGA